MWYSTAKKQPKILTLMRGLPGSGKSTLAREVGKNGQIFSTDDFWMQDGEYKFDPERIGEAHRWNQERALEAMRRGDPHIVIDNTHIEPWEAFPYAEGAQKHGYDVQVKEVDTPWRFNVEELARRNTHGVPLDVIRQMVSKWSEDYSLPTILKSKAPWEDDQAEDAGQPSALPEVLSRTLTET